MSLRKGPGGERIKLKLGDRRVASDQYGLKLDFPSVVQGSDASLRPDALVLGVEIQEGATRAYPVNLLRAHVVNDVIAGQPVVVTYCPRCGSGLAFDRRLSSSQLTFSVFGNERYKRNKQMFRLVLMDESGTLWDQEGHALYGELSGASLTPLPTEMTTWREWKRRFPNTSVMDGDETGSRARVTLESLLLRDRDGSLELPVLGVADGPVVAAYSLKRLSELGGALIDPDGPAPIVVLRQPCTFIGKAFRAPEGAELQVACSADVEIRDKRTGWKWDATGEPVAAGPRLEPLLGQRITRLYAWLIDHPDSRLVGIGEVEPAEPTWG